MLVHAQAPFMMAGSAKERLNHRCSYLNVNAYPSIVYDGWFRAGKTEPQMFYLNVNAYPIIVYDGRFNTGKTEPQVFLLEC